MSSPKPHLPQLPAVMPSGAATSSGAFARSYVVHHLQEEAQIDTSNLLMIVTFLYSMNDCEAK